MSKIVKPKLTMGDDGYPLPLKEWQEVPRKEGANGGINGETEKLGIREMVRRLHALSNRGRALLPPKDDKPRHKRQTED